MYTWHYNQDYLKKGSLFQERRLFHQQMGLGIKKDTSKVLHLEHSFVWCWNLDTSESSSEIPGKFWNVALEKDWED
jgi:hypothetical protein